MMKIARCRAAFGHSCGGHSRRFAGLCRVNSFGDSPEKCAKRPLGPIGFCDGADARGELYWTLWGRCIAEPCSPSVGAPLTFSTTICRSKNIAQSRPIEGENSQKSRRKARSLASAPSHGSSVRCHSSAYHPARAPIFATFTFLAR